LISLRNNKLSQSQLKEIKGKQSALLESLRGAAGMDGAQGLQGVQGLQGDTGKAGKPGMAGESGRDGARGPAGPQGPKGDKGESIQGTQGEAGQNGRGVESVAISGVSLIITYTDGSRVNVGRVVGHTGQRGVPGKTGGVFGNTTSNTTNITEEVLSPTDSANLALIADNSTETKINVKEQLLRVEKELKYIKTHLSLMTDEELNDSDIGRDEQ